MNITFIIPFNAINGGHRVISTYARKLTEYGHRVNVVSQPLDTRIRPKDRIKRLLGRPNNYQTTPVRSPLLDFLGDRHRVLDRPGPPRPEDVPDADAIIATWWETAEWVATLPTSKGRKFYLLQDYETFPYLPVERVIATYKLPLKKIAVSEYIRSEIEKNHGFGEIDVIPNAIDTQQFRAPIRPKNSALTIGFLYTTSSRKNIRLAIDTLKLAKLRIPELQASVFGSRPIAPDLPLPDWARYEEAPDQSRIPEIYASCDLWLFTSDHEGFGLPILEAMACRTPVLATHAGAAPQLIDGRNGVLRPADAKAFADEIARFAQMPDMEWRKMSAAAHRTAAGYTWDDATDRLLALLQSEATKAQTEPDITLPSA